jgi:hypothetical protein
MQDPKESHWKAVKRIIRYLKGTTHFGIEFSHSSDSVVGYTDFDLAGHDDDWKSTSRYSTGPLVWSCKKHKVVSMSTIEAEYHGVVQAGTEAMWIRQLLGELGLPAQS